MQWQASGIILSIHKYAEHAAVVSLFTREQGLVSGMARAALSSKQRGIYQPGNAVDVTWKARLQEHLGSITCEMQRPYAALLMQDPLALGGLLSVCALTKQCFLEHDPHPELYDALLHLLETMAAGQGWQAEYVRFELALITQSGFGLDLGHCAVTGAAEGLTHVSPKSGRAVSAEAAQPYRDRLLRLPSFLTTNNAPEDSSELLDGLAIASHFLEQWVFPAHQRRMPAARAQLVERLKASKNSVIS